MNRVWLGTFFSLATVAAVALTVSPTAKVAAQAAPDPASPEFYTQKVQPIFQANCARCHLNGNRRGSLSLETRATMLKGGTDGTVIVPGHPETSLLVALIRHEGPKDDPMPMPPRSKISDDDIATVTAWIKAGAITPDGQ